MAHYTVEFKLRILLSGFRHDIPIVDLCQRERIRTSSYYQWRKQFLQGVMSRFSHYGARRPSGEQILKLRIENNLLKHVLRIFKKGGLKTKNESPSLMVSEPNRWMLRILQNRYPLSDAISELGEVAGLDTLLQYATSGEQRQRNRAISILARSRGIPVSTITNSLHTNRSCVNRYWARYKATGVRGLLVHHRETIPIANDELIAKAVFTILHSPPSGFGINRTSWRMEDLKECLARNGVFISQHNIRRVIKKAGYTWRKAKVVLTSSDPQFKQKLNRIKSILASLGEDERFFSIDEFGPFSIKMKGGRRLVGPDEYPSVPQFQASKGCLILIAALELSSNQVTHFYSKGKDTDVMIYLLDILLDKYKGCRRIFLSWDAASWHISKKLNTRIDEVNTRPYRRRNGTPRVVLAPLPASAQFLNVIESVFSGMARAIIHNSDYPSVDEAKAAIDRYFVERNEHFRNYPRVAGNKIWGNELEPSCFNEAHNCKDRRFR